MNHFKDLQKSGHRYTYNFWANSTTLYVGNRGYSADYLYAHLSSPFFGQHCGNLDFKIKIWIKNEI